MLVMKIKMVVERTKTGYSAYAAKYPVYTTGKSLDELKANMLEAVNLYFEKKGKNFTGKDLEITLDLPQFFEFYKVINAKALSERIGMNQSLLAQYINGNKKPSRTQTLRILKGVQQIGSELAAIRFLL
jgi:predicted RNase H-like HicB family nuclease